MSVKMLIYVYLYERAKLGNICIVKLLTLTGGRCSKPTQGLVGMKLGFNFARQIQWSVQSNLRVFLEKTERLQMSIFNDFSSLSV